MKLPSQTILAKITILTKIIYFKNVLNIYMLTMFFYYIIYFIKNIHVMESIQYYSWVLMGTQNVLMGSPTNENSVDIYYPWCHCKTVPLSFFSETQNKTFFMSMPKLFSYQQNIKISSCVLQKKESRTGLEWHEWVNNDN